MCCYGPRLVQLFGYLQCRLGRCYKPIVCCYEPRLVQLFEYLQCRLGRSHKPIVCCYEPRLVQLFEYFQCRRGRSHKPNVCCEPRLLKHLQCCTIFSSLPQTGGQLRLFLGCIPLSLSVSQPRIVWKILVIYILLESLALDAIFRTIDIYPTQSLLELCECANFKAAPSSLQHTGRTIAPFFRLHSSFTFSFSTQDRLENSRDIFTFGILSLRCHFPYDPRWVGRTRVPKQANRMLL